MLLFLNTTYKFASCMVQVKHGYLLYLYYVYVLGLSSKEHSSSSSSSTTGIQIIFSDLL